MNRDQRAARMSMIETEISRYVANRRQGYFAPTPRPIELSPTVDQQMRRALGKFAA